ncbi:MAG: phosphoribosyltransferase [Ardenticatenaceae bacterium]
MSSNPYDYESRQGILPISWADFHGICKALARAVARFEPEIILAIGRGGFYPGTLLAHMLRVEIYPVRLSRRVNDIVTHEIPQWRVEPPAAVKGQRVLIVDEICGSGETIAMVRQRVEVLGTTAIKSAVMYAHTWGVGVPDYIGIITDALILNPWDREIYQDGQFRFHPEYVDALSKQGLGADPSLLIQAPAITLAKE